MSEHPNWKQFKLEEEHQAYIADLDTEPEMVVSNMPFSYSEEEWKSILAQYATMEKEGVDG
jgi:hypothetical protein